MSNYLLSLLQLCNSSLPLGAYSYSEGLEFLVENGNITNGESLRQWLENELFYGSIRIEGAIAFRAYNCYLNDDCKGLYYWNNWLSASRETKELREQSWQMGKSLCRLTLQLIPDDKKLKSVIDNFDSPCNSAIAFGIISAYSQIPSTEMLWGYLHSWLNNLVNGGVKLIPLGQTEGQKLIFNLHESIINTTQQIINLQDDQLASCSWGLSFASIHHETLYSRLFRS
ncbi:urease accessory protein UreF [Cyanobacterium aponinum]|uniref:Urease accessory protein UreF n=1 Tax=Cyanobacterium aponinum (strain PCC 10605) TaxID=755178 RepID=K9Z5Z1_CYAAP|nr:urease accessory protein UreF [Cyanobacterium aponinum]AFZ54606.1 Urease accessory protein ureF [Cyanobacterium aponinum PCC 10605]